MQNWVLRMARLKDEQLFIQSATRFWTPHSNRTFLPTATAVLGFEKSVRDFLGAWSAQASENMQRTVVAELQKGLEDPLAEAETLAQFNEFLSAQGVPHQERNRCSKLLERSSATEVPRAPEELKTKEDLEDQAEHPLKDAEEQHPEPQGLKKRRGNALVRAETLGPSPKKPGRRTQYHLIKGFSLFKRFWVDWVQSRQSSEVRAPLETPSPTPPPHPPPPPHHHHQCVLREKAKRQAPRESPGQTRQIVTLLESYHCFSEAGYSCPLQVHCICRLFQSLRCDASSVGDDPLPDQRVRCAYELLRWQADTSDSGSQLPPPNQEDEEIAADEFLPSRTPSRAERRQTQSYSEFRGMALPTQLVQSVYLLFARPANVEAWIEFLSNPRHTAYFRWQVRPNTAYLALVIYIFPPDGNRVALT